MNTFGEESESRGEGVRKEARRKLLSLAEGERFVRSEMLDVMLLRTRGQRIGGGKGVRSFNRRGCLVPVAQNQTDRIQHLSTLFSCSACTFHFVLSPECKHHGLQSKCQGKRSWGVEVEGFPRQWDPRCIQCPLFLVCLGRRQTLFLPTKAQGEDERDKASLIGAEGERRSVDNRARRAVRAWAEEVTERKAKKSEERRSLVFSRSLSSRKGGQWLCTVGRVEGNMGVEE